MDQPSRMTESDSEEDLASSQFLPVGVEGLLITSISNHARKRTAQRGIELREVELAILIGEDTNQDGAIIFFLGRRQLVENGFISPDRKRLEGLTVLMSRDGTVITAYRNRSGVAARLRRRGHQPRRLRI
jgi:hypothetical protein